MASTCHTFRPHFTRVSSPRLIRSSDWAGRPELGHVSLTWDSSNRPSVLKGSPLAWPRLSRSCPAVWGPPCWPFLPHASFSLASLLPEALDLCCFLKALLSYSSSPLTLLRHLCQSVSCTSKYLLALAFWRMHTDLVGKIKWGQGDRKGPGNISNIFECLSN